MFNVGDIIRATSDSYGYTDIRRNYIGVVLSEADDDNEIYVKDIFLTTSGGMEVFEFDEELHEHDRADCWYVEDNEEHFELLTKESLYKIYMDTFMTDEQYEIIKGLIGDTTSAKVFKKTKYYKFDELLKGVV